MCCAVPEGTSAYQAAWILDDYGYADDDGGHINNDDDDDDDDDDDEEEEEDDGMASDQASNGKCTTANVFVLTFLSFRQPGMESDDEYTVEQERLVPLDEQEALLNPSKRNRKKSNKTDDDDDDDMLEDDEDDKRMWFIIVACGISKIFHCFSTAGLIPRFATKAKCRFMPRPDLFLCSILFCFTRVLRSFVCLRTKPILIT